MDHRARRVRIQRGTLRDRRSARPGRSSGGRSWRRRGRKAQASAVATILGLLLVVTFIANYLTTTLPQYMSVNDINHNLLVQNEFGHLDALLMAASADRAVGAQLSQPIQLGSQGLPPFAQPDGGSLGPTAGGVQEKVKFAISGGFNPPGPGVANSGVYTKVSCSISPAGSSKPTGISCLTGGTVIWNFSAGNHQKYSVSSIGGLNAALNFSTNGSHIAIGGVGGATNRVYIDGSNNTIYLNTTGGITENVLVVGNYNTLNLGTTGGGTFKVTVIGTHDAVTATTSGGVTIHMVAYGQHDSFTESEIGGGTYNIFYTGFHSVNPQVSKCPVANLALTDTVAGSPGGTVTYNDTTYTNAGHAGNASGWVYNYLNPAASTCPYVAGGAIALSTLASGLVAQLKNNYDPSAQVALDSGGVVFAQYGGIPALIDPPPIKATASGVTIWMPLFTSQISSEGGIGTAVVDFTLLSVQTQTYPSGGYSLGSGGVTITITTPYSAAWMAYFGASSVFASHATCTPAGSTECSPTGKYLFGAPDGTVVLALPATSLTVVMATFSIGLD
jgi:hypothetical protein